MNFEDFGVLGFQFERK